jgi:hypothetical protein
MVINRKHVMVIGIGVAAAAVIIALLATGIIPVVAKGNIIVTLVDEETGKRVGRVDGGYPRVILDGVDQGYLTDYGELKIEGVNPGTRELTVVVPYYGEVKRFVEVGAGQIVPATIEINMPNPVFRVGVEAKSYLKGFDELGYIKVSLTNIGDADSRSTSVLVLVYREDDLTTPIATKVLDFPSLVPRTRGGETVTREWPDANFVWGPKEIVAVVVFDAWPFTPQNDKVVSEISVSSSVVSELAYSILNYLKQHPELIVKTIAQILIAWYG